MHELSIAESVVQAASRHAEGRRVTKAYLKVGHLRQVVPSALAFGFELLAQGTQAEGAELETQEAPATGLCRTCGREGRLDGFSMLCTACGSHDLRIIGGRNLLVTSLDLQETQDHQESWRLIPEAVDRRGPSRVSSTPTMRSPGPTGVGSTRRGPTSST